MNLGTQSVTRKRATVATDEYHNEVFDWSAPTTDLPMAGCSVQPGGGSTIDADREASTVLYTVFAAPTYDVTETDRITHAGTDYAIESIERWIVGTPLDHLVIRLEKVTG